MLKPEDLFLEIPELSLPEKFYEVQEPFTSELQQKANDFMSGLNLDSSGSANFITTTKDSPWETANIHPDTAKELLEWCRSHFTLKFCNVYFIRTKPGQCGPWHSEGPIFKSRRCALNFLVSGELGKCKAQWGVHKTIDVHPEEIEKHFAGAVPDDQVDVIAEYISREHVPFFYNTACLHRSFNESTDQPRTILSVSLFDSIGIAEIRKMLENGTLLK